MRGFYRNDQRIEWSGVEATIGAEGVLAPAVRMTQKGWTIGAAGEFFLNQRFGASILSDDQRDIYRANFEIDPFEVFQLYCLLERGDFQLRFGKIRTPFGNYPSPSYSNQRIDAPFQRTDVIGFTETGLFVGYNPGWLRIDAGVINGEPNLDTNSSKGALARIGAEGDWGGAGLSGKIHDGVASEQQKRFNNVYGLDAHLKSGGFTLYSEAIYEEHGFHSPDYNRYVNPLLFGVRSLYGRDAFSGVEDRPIKGYGSYLGVLYEADHFLIDLNYGVQFPQTIGDPQHDLTIHRFVGKLDFALTPNLHLFTVGILENQRPELIPHRPSSPFAIITGMQFVF